MPRKKITVVDVEDNNDVNPEINDVTEPVQEQIKNIPSLEQEQVIEEAKVDDATTPIETPSGLEEDKPIEDKKIRSQQLIRCLKCNKMVTAKTLKYSHKQTCPGEEHNKVKKNIVKTKKQETTPEPIPEPIPDPIPEPIPEPIPDPVPEAKPKPKPKPKAKAKAKAKPEPKYDEAPVPDPPKQITITSDMMREHRKLLMIEKLQASHDKMKNLFTNSLK